MPVVLIEKQVVSVATVVFETEARVVLEVLAVLAVAFRALLLDLLAGLFVFPGFEPATALSVGRYSAVVGFR